MNLKDIFSRGPKIYAGPHGTLLADWEFFEFEPQTDITAYELAIIHKALGSDYFGFAGGVYVHSNPAMRVERWDEISRHFKATGQSAVERGDGGKGMWD